MGSDWDRYIKWAKRIYSVRDFDSLERDYKLAAFGRLKRAVDSFIRGRTGLGEIKHAIQGFNNVRWQEIDSFVKWGNRERAAARGALKSLWQPGPGGARLDAFVTRTPGDLIASPAARINFCSVFLAARDPRKYVPFRHRPLKRTYELTGYPPPPPMHPKVSGTSTRWRSSTGCCSKHDGGHSCCATGSTRRGSCGA